MGAGLLVPLVPELPENPTSWPAAISAPTSMPSANEARWM